MDEKLLKERALQRCEATWTPLDLDYVGNEAAPLEETINILGADSIRAGMVAADEAANFNEGLRDKLFELEMLEVTQEQQIILDRYIAEKQAYALRVAGELLLLAAREYDIQIQQLIMDARKYEALVDREKIELQKQRALMDIRKEEAQLDELEARILLELIERRNQEIEYVKAKVDVAKANVRAVLADVQAEEAEVRVIQAQLEVLRAEADKADLIADVAHIMANIVVRGLAKVRLAVETAEVEAGFTWIQQRLNDALAIIETRIDIEEIRETYEKLLKAEVELYREAQKEYVDLKKLRMAMEQRLEMFKQAKQKMADLCAKAIKETEEYYKEALAQVQTQAEINTHNIKQWADSYLYKAKSIAGTREEIQSYHVTHYGQKIIKGFYSARGGAGNILASSLGLEGSSPPNTTVQDVSVSAQRCTYEEPYL